ncbi:Na+/H+ antiporter NhaC family protein [Alicyclobacillus acidocaldarius]|uniref:Na+/H+ antiporter NhaC-like protein n=1 Tax=Alicyclobacillus acidocaldarius (strain Tc-4-1) TaxID=1048834 RepID=F8IHF6_ALIAT|nr:Na+/H+ antiporter NhaC family protein [Alicyclobacillus acidocaldarius]AEJ44429.1 Na+/H+ antiporter NhaC-like protein [Alicyclobacillus acidocaldarius subsp. acidocaldarius Tc-4-1]
MHGSFASIVPFIVIIPVALLTKQVILGLALGLFVGCYIEHPRPLAGLESAIAYIGRELGLSGNMSLILFLYLFGSFVGLLRVSGGVKGFSRWMEARIHSPRGAFVFTWLSSLFTCMAPDFRILTVAPIVSRVFERFRIAKEQVAFTIDVTATPLCAVVPIGTAFVAYMVGLMHTSAHHTAAASPYALFLATIPYNFFAWAMLLMGAFLTFFRFSTQVRTSTRMTGAMPDGGEVSPFPRLAHEHRGVFGLEAGAMAFPQDAAVQRGMRRREAAEEEVPDPVEALAKRAHPSVMNLVFPLALLLASTLAFTVLSGYAPGRTLVQAFVQSNAAKAMLEALVLTVVAMAVLYAVRGTPLHRIMVGFLQGGNEMMPVIVLLALIWAVSAVAADLGFAQFCQREIVQYVPRSLIIPALFIVGCLISYVLGSSFGTWAILMPLAFSLAQGGAGSLAIAAGAVFASGTFGGFVSPLSDNTVAMATVMKVPVMDYANYKLKTALIPVAACVIGYFLLGEIAR